VHSAKVARQLQVGADLGIVATGLPGAQRGDLGAHHRAVHGVIAQQRHAAVIAAGFQPGIQEAHCNIAMPAVQQIHETERDFRDGVDPAQGRAEFDTVENQQLAVYPCQVAQMQIAVALANPPGALRSRINGASRLCSAMLQFWQLFQPPDFRRVFQPFGEQPEIILYRLGYCIRFAPRAIGRSTVAFAEMEASQPRGEPVYLYGTQFAAFVQMIQCGIGRKLAHFYRVFDDFFGWRIV